MVARAQEYIRAGDIFQVVIGQRFERASTADPFETRSQPAEPVKPLMYRRFSGCETKKASSFADSRALRRAVTRFEVPIG